MCELFVKSEVKAQDLTHIKVEISSEEDANASKIVPTADQDFIENENLILEYLHQDD